MRAFKQVPIPPDKQGMGPASPRVFGRRTMFAALTGSAALAAFLVLLGLVQQAPADPSRRSLEVRAADVARTAEAAADRALEVLGPLGRELASEDPPDWRGFDRLIEAAGGAEPWAAVAWAPLVPAGERTNFEVAAGRDAYRSFRIVERDAEGRLRTARPHPYHLPIALVDPAAENEELLGLDLRTDDAVAAALERAADAGAPEAVLSTRLFATPGSEPRLLVVLPVWKTILGSARTGREVPMRTLAGAMLAALPVHAVAPPARAALTPDPELRVLPLPLPELEAAHPGRPAPLTVRAPFYVGQRPFAVELSVRGPEQRLWARRTSR